MTKDELIALAEVERKLGNWLLDYAHAHPMVPSAFNAALTCHNREAAFRALAQAQEADDAE